MQLTMSPAAHDWREENRSAGIPIKTSSNQQSYSMKKCVFSLCRSWWLSRSIFGPDYRRTHTSPECLRLPPTERVNTYTGLNRHPPNDHLVTYSQSDK